MLPPHHERDINPADRSIPLAATLCTLGFAASFILGRIEPLGVVHADDLTHYLFARWAWTWPSYLLNDWGRPGFTALYYLPAWFGWGACRACSALLTALTAWFAHRIANGMGLRQSWVVVPLCFLQPLLFKLSQTTLTETPLAFYLTLGLYLAQRRRWAFSSCMISIAFVTRHEAIIFLPIWLYFGRRDRVPFVRLLPIIWAPVVVNSLAPLCGVGTILSRWIDPASTGQYGRGGWLTFFSRSLEAFGPGIMVLAMVGLPATLKRPAGAMPAVTACAYFATQTVIRALGLYDSGGYARFLVPIGPILAVFALDGLQALGRKNPSEQRRAILLAIASMLLLWVSMERQLVLYAMRQDEIAEIPEVHHAKLAMRIATAAMVAIGCLLLVAKPRHKPPARFVRAGLLILIALSTYALSGRVHAPPEVDLVRGAHDWLKVNANPASPVISASVWIDHLTGQSLPPNRPATRKRIELAPVGSYFAWDRQFAPCPDHKVPLSDLRDSGCFVQVYESAPRPNESDPFIRLFRKTAPWPAVSHDIDKR